MSRTRNPETQQHAEEHTEQQFRAFVEALNGSHHMVKVTRTEQVMEGAIKIEITATLKKRKAS